MYVFSGKASSATKTPFFGKLSKFDSIAAFRVEFEKTAASFARPFAPTSI